MLKGNRNKIIISLLLILGVGSTAIAQNEDALGSHTPYNLFGIGDISKQGSSLNRGMGGIGIGLRDNRYINYLNPASITKRDTLSFMFDFGIFQRNMYTTDGTRTAPFNTLNISHITFTAPIYRKSALIFGVAPISNTGYSFSEVETDLDLISEHGNIRYSRYGTGSISKLFAGASLVLFKNLSVGVEGNYYFGSIKHHSNINFEGDGASQESSGVALLRSINTGKDNTIKSLGGKIGLQYEKNFSENVSLTLGATFAAKTDLKGDQTRYIHTHSLVTGRVDTVKHETSDITYTMPMEIGLGFSLRKRDKWMVGVDYTRQDWTDSKFDATPGVDFRTAAANSFKMGFEYIPNRYDVRYYMKRLSYRGGVYYDQGYMKISGQQINSMGATFGITLPISSFYNSIGVSVDVGQRGTFNNNLLKENYVMFNINISLHEIWFRKLRYD